VVLNRDEAKKARALIVLGLGGLLACFFLALPGGADAGYRDNPPNRKGDALLLTRIYIAQEDPNLNWSRCAKTGVGLLDHITIDRRGWFKRSFKSSAIGKSFMKYKNQKGEQRYCSWAQDNDLHTALPFMMQVWFKAVYKDYWSKIRQGFRKAVCNLKWGVFWTSLGVAIPVKFATIPWVIKNAVLNGISAKDYC
jgi:hypothetical protein